MHVPLGSNELIKTVELNEVVAAVNNKKVMVMMVNNHVIWPCAC